MADFSRVVVTGGAGFIGSNYVHLAAREHPDWQLVVLDKLTYAGNPENLADLRGQIEFIQGDIADGDVVDRALDGADAVVNFAAESHVDRSLLDSMPFVRTNVEGTAVLLAAALRHQVRRFCHVSTDEVYGDMSGTTRLSCESDPLKPRNPYSATKASAEHLVGSYHISYGLDAVITRGSNTYGPYQYPEKIIPLFVTNAAEGKPLPLYRDGSAVRDYMYVDDHCRGIDAVLHRGEPGEVYNLGARLEINGVTVAENICRLTGMGRELITFVADREGHDYRYAVDPAKAEALGWARAWTFEDGLAETVRWYLGHADWWKPLKQHGAYTSHQKSWYGQR